ncbi:hypothetical protein ACLI4Q_04650 [Natrialbaceae archaeon A-CW1-1]
MMTKRPARADSTQFAFTGGFIIGVALVVLGIGAWVLSDFASMTALIPVLFGILVVGFASLGRETDRERLAVYGIGALGVLAVLGSLRAVADIIALATGEEVDNVVAVASQGIMLLLGLALVVIAVRAVLADR